MKLLFALLTVTILSSCGPQFQTANLPTTPTGPISPGHIPLPPPVVIPAHFISVSTPLNSNAPVSGIILVSGNAGSEWVNVAVFDADNGYANVSSADFSPVDDKYYLTLNTAQFPNGVRHLNVTGYSVTSGHSGGTYSSVFFNIDVEN